MGQFSPDDPGQFFSDGNNFAMDMPKEDCWLIGVIKELYASPGLSDDLKVRLVAKAETLRLEICQASKGCETCPMALLPPTGSEAISSAAIRHKDRTNPFMAT